MRGGGERMLSQFQVLPGSMGDWKVKGETAKAATKSNQIQGFVTEGVTKKVSQGRWKPGRDGVLRVSWPGWDFEWSEC